jgi:hypothetical protein
MSGDEGREWMVVCHRRRNDEAQSASKNLVFFDNPDGASHEFGITLSTFPGATLVVFSEEYAVE